MAVSVINGTNGAGTYLEGANADILKITTSLESMNNPGLVGGLKGMDFMESFIRTVDGVQGHTEAFKANQAYVSDDGSFQDGIAYQESYGHWSFTRRGYTVKDKDFTHKMLIEADERDIPLGNLVDDRIKVIMDLYTNKYIPNVVYETLFTLPTVTSGTYYSEPKGFLSGQVVPEDMLNPGVDASVARNHYRCIANSAGLTIDDIEWVVEYMSEYMDITDSDIIALGTRGSLFQLKNAIAWQGNQDIFNRTGQPATDFAGVRFITNDFIPKDMILFLDGSAPELVTKLQSPKAQYRGMAVVKEKGFSKLEDVYDLVGSKFKIMPEGYHLTGRHYGLILDINKTRTSADRVMGAAGKTALKNYATQLRNRWYRGLR